METDQKLEQAAAPPSSPSRGTKRKPEEKEQLTPSESAKHRKCDPDAPWDLEFREERMLRFKKHAVDEKTGRDLRVEPTTGFPYGMKLTVDYGWDVGRVANEIPFCTAEGHRFLLRGNAYRVYASTMREMAHYKTSLKTDDDVGVSYAHSKIVLDIYVKNRPDKNITSETLKFCMQSDLFNAEQQERYRKMHDQLIG